MALTADKVVVELEAKLGHYAKNVNHARELFGKAMDFVDRRGKESSKEMDKNFGGIANQIKLAFAGIGTAVLAREAIQFIDSWKRATNALAVAGLEGRELTSIMDQLFEAAQRNSAPIESLTTLYGRAAQASDNLGASQQDLMRFAEGVAVSLRVAGTSAEAAQGALLQLGQLISSATVQAEEFNSVNEGARPILQAVAKGLDAAGGSVSRLKQLVVDGQVSGKEFFDAFLIGLPQIEEMANRAGQTFEQVFTKINNAFTKYIGQTDESLGASMRVIEGLNALADNFEETADMALKFAGIVAGALVGRAFASALTVIPLIIFGFKAFRIAALGAAGAAQILAVNVKGSATAVLALAAAQKQLRWLALLQIIGPIGFAIGAAAAALYLFGNNAREAAEKSEAMKQKLVELGYLSAEAAGSIEKTTEKIRDLRIESMRLELDRVNEELEKIGNTSFKPLEGSLGEIVASLRAIQAGGMDGLISDEQEAARRMEELIQKYLAGQASVEELNKLLDELAAKRISGPMDALIASARRAIAVFQALIAYKNALLEGISGKGPAGPSSEDTEKAATVAANRALRIQKEASDAFIADRQRYMNLNDKAKDIEDRAKSIMTAAKAAKVILSEEQAMLQATAEINKEYAEREADKADSAGSKIEDKAGDAFRDLQDRTEMLKLEASLIGATTRERERAITAMELENQLRADNVEISPAILANIQKEAAAYADAQASLERITEQYQQWQELQQAVGDQMVDVLSSIATHAQTTEEIVKGLLQWLIRVSLQAALLGQGPFAGVFGTASGGNAIGGAVGAAFGAIGGRAGPVNVPTPKVGAGPASPNVVHVNVTSGQMFDATVAKISGNVSVVHSKAAVDLATRQGSKRAMAELAEHQRAYA